jgi:surfactin synthase thioesterase subunit
MMTKTRLICFHHAGGTAAAFRSLTRALDPEIPVTTVNLPGRGARMGEPRHHDVNACATQLADELGPYLDEPHVLLGHSMGAMIAYTIAQQRILSFRRGPEALIVVSHGAPHLASAVASIEREVGSTLDDVDDWKLATTMSQFGGIPAELLAQPKWLAALMPLLRDDLRICASYRDRGEPPLPCPVHVFGGDVDPLVTSGGLYEWRQHTHQPGPVTIVTGGHFLFGDPDPCLVQAITQILAVGAPPREPARRYHTAVDSAKRSLTAASAEAG